MLAGLDRVVLRRQAERVVAHRVQHAAAGAAVEVRHRVADGVVLQVPHVRLAGRVRQHLEHVGLRRAGDLVVGDLPGALALPDLLPLGLDRARVVAVLAHGARRLARARSCRRIRPGCELVFVFECRSTTLKGAIAEAAITAAAVELGVVVLRPVIEGGRYDLVFDSTIVSIACSANGRRAGAASSTSVSRRAATRRGLRVRTYDADEIDAVAAYCQELKRCYWLPIEMVAGRRAVHLRLEPRRQQSAIGDKLRRAVLASLGAIAQLGERLAGSQKVVGSSPTSSTSRPS